MAMCREWNKKGSFGKLWNGALLEDEEGEDLESRRCRRLKQELESGD